ncbi:MAG: hypothetical protein RL556_320 [Actinomycetota bacterium]|jgi:cytochrome oxidase assembly protein ShyY1
MNSTWWQVARRPKWIGAFFIAMAFAAICALLAQWQASRSFETAVTRNQITIAKPIDQVVNAGVPARAGAVGSLVTANLMIDYSNALVVANRVQKDGSQGFWLVGEGRTETNNVIAVSLGFAATKAQAIKSQAALKGLVQIQAFTPIEGLLMPSEGPKALANSTSPILESLSLGQLVNLWQVDAKAYPLFLLASKPAAIAPGLEPVSITPPSTETQINWLSAFYAIEWTLFCGFGFFLWWRLVRDAQLLENSESQAKESLG